MFSINALGGARELVRAANNRGHVGGSELIVAVLVFTVLAPFCSVVAAVGGEAASFVALYDGAGTDLEATWAVCGQRDFGLRRRRRLKGDEHGRQ